MPTDRNDVYHSPARQPLFESHAPETEERRFQPWPSDEYCRRAKRELEEQRRNPGRKRSSSK